MITFVKTTRDKKWRRKQKSQSYCTISTSASTFVDHDNNNNESHARHEKSTESSSTTMIPSLSLSKSAPTTLMRKTKTKTKTMRKEVSLFGYNNNKNGYHYHGHLLFSLSYYFSCYYYCWLLFSCNIPLVSSFGINIQQRRHFQSFSLVQNNNNIGRGLLFPKTSSSSSSSVYTPFSSATTSTTFSTSTSTTSTSATSTSTTTTALFCQLLGMNCATPTDFTFSLQGFCKRGGETDIHSDGWGVAFYQNSGLRQFHDVEPASTSNLAQFLSTTPIRTLNMMGHIRYATVGCVDLSNVHPFCREMWGIQWCFAHNGEVPLFHTTTSNNNNNNGKTIPVLQALKQQQQKQQPKTKYEGITLNNNNNIGGANGKIVNGIVNEKPTYDVNGKTMNNNNNRMNGRSIINGDDDIVVVSVGNNDHVNNNHHDNNIDNNNNKIDKNNNNSIDKDVMFYNPIGSTDSEATFCAILNALRNKFQTLPSMPVLYEAITLLCNEIVMTDPNGTILNFLLTCGPHTQWVYSWPGRRPGSKIWNGLHYTVREYPFSKCHLCDMDYTVDFSTTNTKEDCVSVIATKPLTDDEQWIELSRGELLLFDQGKPYKTVRDLFRVELSGHGLNSTVLAKSTLEEDMRIYNVDPIEFSFQGEGI